MQLDPSAVHDWPGDFGQARAIQEKLRQRVITRDAFGPVHRIAGVDIGLDRANNRAHAAVVVLDFDGLGLLEQATAHERIRCPYVPGYLSFREVPPILKALEKLTAAPDLIICDGQGIAHPRRFGLACHLGVLTGIATIGAAKSRLTGTFTEPGPDKGDWSPLMDGSDTIGAVLRTRTGVRPLYVSIGHKVSLQSAVRIVLACCTRYRLPETTRAADRLASGEGKFC
ncbi:MAG TPA: deoxyribonuclease V [Arenicellales bacterium]|nr:deoxyribonuclease V [Arenicellales bacterium]